MRKFTLLFLSLLLSLTVGLAQQRVITGVVLLAPDNEPAIGASILVKEHTRSGVLVGTDGKFKITVPAGSKTFRISFMGYKTVEVPIKDKMRVVLESDSKTLSTIVVTGMNSVSSPGLRPRSEATRPS